MRFSLMIEIFDPKDGKPIMKVRLMWVARLITWLFPAYDYAGENEGWKDA